MSETQAPHGSSRDDAPSEAVRILVVDDEPSYRDYLERFLTRAGLDVRTAGTGREAVELAEAFAPEILLADWMLKNQMHGLEVARALRARHPALRVLLMTGFPSSEIRDEADREGVDGFLEKPFGLDEVRDAIDRAVDRLRS